MNHKILNRPVLTLTTLACLAATVMSCEKNSPKPQPPASSPPPAPASATEPTPASAAASSATIATNPVAVHNGNVPDTDIATTTTNAKPATPAVDTSPTIAGTHAAPAPAPAPAPVIKHVEMPETAPTMPTNFYPAGFAGQPSYYLRFRAGYEHINYRNNNDASYVGVKFYAHNDDLRAQADKNGWLVPDADVELAHHLLAKPDANLPSGTGQGVSVNASLYWPWLKWSLHEMSHNNSPCPLARPLTLTLGPVASGGFEKLDDGTGRMIGYAGARLNLNRDAFIEYTLGRTDGLSGNRQQITAELPLSVSRDGEVRYVVRGTWNHLDTSHRDILTGGLFLELPFTTLAKPSKWSDLIPFKQ